MAIADIRTLVKNKQLRISPWEDAINDGSGINNTVTSVTVDSSAQWFEGDLMEFQDDGEVAYVETDASASSVTIKRGHFGTTAGSHSDNVVLQKSPRFFIFEIDDAITRVINQLPGEDIYERKEDTITPSTSTYVFDAPADFEFMIGEGLYQLATGSIERHTITRAEVKMLVPAAESSTNRAIYVDNWKRTDVDGTLFYGADPVVGTTDTEMREIIALGATARLLAAEPARLSGLPQEQDPTRGMIFTAREAAQEFEAAKKAWRAKRRREDGNIKRFRLGNYVRHQ